MSYYTDTFTFSSVFTGDWWNDQPPTQGGNCESPRKPP